MGLPLAPRRERSDHRGQLARHVGRVAVRDEVEGVGTGARGRHDDALDLVGARPLSSDGRPLLGRAPGHDDVYVASGHGPWGISLGPASARVVADLVLGREPALSRAFDPARFGSIA